MDEMVEHERESIISLLSRKGFQRVRSQSLGLGGGGGLGTVTVWWAGSSDASK
jgi:hypothetical protein